jgi:hypothetical protein
MQAYQSIIIPQYNIIDLKINLLFSIIKNNIFSYKITPDFVSIGIKRLNHNYTIKVYYEKTLKYYKPLYILADFEFTKLFEKKLCNKIELMNMDIDNYDCVEDIAYDLTTWVNESTYESVNKK